MTKTKRTSMNLPIDMSNKLKMIAMAKSMNQTELIIEYLQKGIDEDISLAKNLLD